MNKELYKFIINNINLNIEKDKLIYLYKVLNNPLIIDKPKNLKCKNKKLFSNDNIFNFLHLYQNYLHTDLDISAIENYNYIDFVVYEYIINHRKEFLKKLKPFVNNIYKPKLNLNKINVFKINNYIFVRNKFKMFYDKNLIRFLQKIKINEYYLELIKTDKYYITNFYHQSINKNIFKLQYKNLFYHI